MKTETGGPAFPSGAIRESRPAHDPGAAYHVTDRLRPVSEGISMRDYFAAKAMQGLMGRNWERHIGTDAELMRIWAKSAYFVADAMLEARAK